MKKIIKIIPKNKIQFFNYEDIVNNKKKFIEEFSSYLGIQISDDLIEKMSIKTRVTSKNKKGEYQFETKNRIFELFKFLIPQFLLNKLKFLLNIKFIRYFLFKKIKVTNKNDILEKIINELF